MKMVVGLGNHGKEYDGTRHNVGFDALDILAKEKWKRHYNCMTSKSKKGLLLVKPLAGMNTCGPDVEKVRRHFDVALEDVIVIHDEMDFEPGYIKLKFGGGDGKHNGLKTLISNMGPDFCRVRIGIGKPKKNNGVEFVLGQFPKHERKLINEAITDALAATLLIADEGIQSAMVFFNNFNRKK